MSTATAPHSDLCSCGDSADHVIAKRTTSDGKLVLFWSDGLVTYGMGFGIPGIGRSRACYARRYDRKAGELAAADLELYTAAEVPKLIKAARRAVRLPGVYTDDGARRAMRAYIAS